MLTQESLIQAIGDQPIPPVELWNPEFCGELDLLIKADGSWLYCGSPITRDKIKLLFSRVIKKENENYFLVTPVEKVAIEVEWLPFVIVDYQVIQHDQKSTYQFVDSFDNIILLIEPSQIQFSEYQKQRLPIINVRRNLFASFSRSCYYRLLNEAKIISDNDQNQVVIESYGLKFLLGNFVE